MHEAMVMHVQGLQEDNLPIPESDAFAEYMAVTWSCPYQTGHLSNLAK